MEPQSERGFVSGQRVGQGGKQSSTHKTVFVHFNPPTTAQEDLLFYPVGRGEQRAFLNIHIGCHKLLDTVCHGLTK